MKVARLTPTAHALQCGTISPAFSIVRQTCTEDRPVADPGRRAYWVERVTRPGRTLIRDPKHVLNIRLALRHRGGARAHCAHCEAVPIDRRDGVGRSIALAEMREPATGRRVQNSRRLQHGRAAHRRPAAARRHHLFVRQSRPGHGARGANPWRACGSRHADDCAKDKDRGTRGHSAPKLSLRAPRPIRTARARGARSRRARPDDGAAVRPRMDHCRPGNRWTRDSRAAARTSPPSWCRSAAAAWRRASRRRSSCRGPPRRSIGVEPSGAASMKASIDAGHVLTLPDRKASPTD